MSCRSDRIGALVGSGFSSLERAFPLVKGMLFEASRRQILGPKLDRVTDAIDRLLAADGGTDENAARIEPESRRKALIRIIILGILAEAGMEAGSVESTVAALRETIGTFLSSFVGLPSPSPIRKDFR